MSVLGTITSFLSQFATDIVAVIDPDKGKQMLANAYSMKANISPTSKLMDHPLEDGTPVTDFKIILPVTVELGVLIDTNVDQDTYREIEGLFELSPFLSVKTNAELYEKLVIESYAHDEVPDMWGMLQLTLRFRQVQIITVQYQTLPPQQVAVATAQSTINRGEQQAQNSVLYDVKNYFSKSN